MIVARAILMTDGIEVHRLCRRLNLSDRNRVGAGGNMAKDKRSNRGKRSGRARAAGRASRQRWLLGIVGIAVAAVVILIIAQQANRPTGANREGLAGGAAKSLGREDAPVVVTVYSDFQCSHCAEFAFDAERQIVENEVKAGTVRLVYKHFWLGSDGSLWAAEASECAAEQGLFWEYHDIIFENQSGGFTKARLKGLAQQLDGLDQNQFGRCLDTDQYRSTVNDDTQEARVLGLAYTPTIIINGKSVVGAYPYATFQDAIEQALADAKPTVVG